MNSKPGTVRFYFGTQTHIKYLKKWILPTRRSSAGKINKTMYVQRKS
jgi:hypothetical protein